MPKTKKKSAERRKAQTKAIMQVKRTQDQFKKKEYVTAKDRMHILRESQEWQEIENDLKRMKRVNISVKQKEAESMKSEEILEVNKKTNTLDLVLIN